MKRPSSLWLLVLLLVFLSIGGFYGGLSMLSDPTGKTLQMDEVLPLLPLPDYFLPGLFLVSIFGIFPLILVYGLIFHPTWKQVDILSSWSGYYWAWTGSILVSIVLILWLVIQGLLIGFQWSIQYVTLANGLLIMTAAFLPGIRMFFRSK